MLPLMPVYLPEEEEEGGGGSIAVTSFPRDMFQHQFLARIVVQFERGKSLDLNECYGDFLGSVERLVQCGIAYSYRICFY